LFASALRPIVIFRSASSFRLDRLSDPSPRRIPAGVNMTCGVRRTAPKNIGPREPPSPIGKHDVHPPPYELVALVDVQLAQNSVPRIIGEPIELTEDPVLARWSAHEPGIASEVIERASRGNPAHELGAAEESPAFI
jgi:hypothetical protein